MAILKFMSFPFLKINLRPFSAYVFHTRRRHFLMTLFVVLLIFSYVQASFAQTEDEVENAVKLFNQGQDAQEKGDFKLALKFYAQAIKIKPDFPEATYQSGTGFASLGKIDEAEKAFRRTIELRGDWVLPLLSLGNLLIEKNQFAEAEKFFSQAIKIDRQNFKAYIGLTELRLRSNASPEMLSGLLAQLQALTSQNNSTASLWAARATLERALKDKISAEKSLKNALSLDPNNVSALSESAEIFIAAGDFTRALDAAQTIVKISPDSIAAKVRLARIYAASGNSDEALKILDVLDNSNAQVAALKNSLSATDTPDVAELEKQSAQSPDNPAVLGRLCALTRRTNPQKSLEYCRRASAAEPNNLEHAIGFGAALVQAKQFENAAALFRRILQIAPGNYAARANLATALFESKQFAAAKAEYEWLTAKKPDLAIGYFFLAITNDQMGQYTDALTNYQKFLRLADAAQNQLEIDKVKLRLPALQKLIKRKGKN